MKEETKIDNFKLILELEIKTHEFRLNEGEKKIIMFYEEAKERLKKGEKDGAKVKPKKISKKNNQIKILEEKITKFQEFLNKIKNNNHNRAEIEKIMKDILYEEMEELTKPYCHYPAYPAYDNDINETKEEEIEEKNKKLEEE